MATKKKETKEEKDTKKKSTSTKKKTTTKKTTTKSTTKKKAKIIKYAASLKNSKGKPIAGKKVTFKIKGKAYVAKTNKKGIAKVSFKNLKVAMYSILIKYLNSQVKATLKIKK